MLFRIRAGVPCRDLPARSGSRTTVRERHRRWSADGTWDRILPAVLADADAQGRVGQRRLDPMPRSPARSRGSAQSTADPEKSSMHSAAPPRRGARTLPGRSDEQNPSGRGRRPPALLIAPGQCGDSPRLIPVLERVRVERLGGGPLRTRPDRLGGDKAHGSHRSRRYPCRRQIEHTMPEPKDRRANRRCVDPAPSVDQVSQDPDVSVTVLREEILSRSVHLRLRMTSENLDPTRSRDGIRHCRSGCGAHHDGCGRSPGRAQCEQ
ncbi:hypothetical protein CG736_01360 [Kitasatospora sp. CB02891]|nr:hypothetical protein CG736_01360 [Kitasatospora sp. CB02891]